MRAFVTRVERDHDPEKLTIELVSTGAVEHPELIERMVGKQVQAIFALLPNEQSEPASFPIARVVESPAIEVPTKPLTKSSKRY